MSVSSKDPTLKEINALKKKLNWGDVPTIYQMAYSSISELDSILSHGFESSFKNLLNRTTWNLDLLGSYKTPDGYLAVKHKPKISIKHVFDQKNYELHCFPIMNGETVTSVVNQNPLCPFIRWIPNTMQTLLRINTLVPFIAYSFQKGDVADAQLVKFAYLTVEGLIDILSESFDIIDIQGLTIAEFYRDINTQIQSNSQG